MRVSNRPLPFTEDQVRQVYETNIIDFAQNNGLQVVNADRNTVKVKGMPDHCGGLYLFKHGRGYHWFSQDKQGDIVSFAMELFGATSKLAAYEMILGCRASPTFTASPKIKPTPKGPLVVPDKMPDNKRAIAYLIKTRGIEPEIVFDMINQGRVYQGIEHRVNQETGELRTYQGVCFASLDKDGKICGGAMRAMSDKSSFRKDFDNNDKSFGFSMPGTSSRVFVYEAAIDAMSHASLLKIQGQDWRADHRVCEGCLSDKALQRYLEQHPDIEEIVWCFDNDMDGVDKDGQPHNHGQLAAEKYRERYSYAYDTAILTPVEKDFNLDLRVAKGVIAPTPQPLLAEMELEPPDTVIECCEAEDDFEDENDDGWEP